MVRTHRILASGLGFLEGPVIGDDGSLYVTSLSQGGIYRVDDDGSTTLVADTNGGCNGATFGRDGVLFIAQNGGRRLSDGPAFPPANCGVQRLDPDGTVSWLTQDPICPNDLCFGPDGMLYVTDPTRSPAMNDGRVWRIDSTSGESELLMSIPWFVNGLAWGPDDRLYLASTGESTIYVSDLVGGSLTPPEVKVRMSHGNPDGLAFDANGNLVIGALAYDSGLGSIQTWTLAGRQLDEFSMDRGRLCTNLAFTSDDALVITYGDLGEVVKVDGWGVAGQPLYPARALG